MDPKEPISEIRNSNLCMRSIMKQLSNGKLNGIQAILQLNDEIDRTTKQLEELAKVRI